MTLGKLAKAQFPDALAEKDRAILLVNPIDGALILAEQVAPRAGVAAPLLSLVAVVRPIRHHHPELLTDLAQPVSRLDLVGDRVGERGFGNIARAVGFFVHPIPEGRADTKRPSNPQLSWGFGDGSAESGIRTWRCR